MLTPGIAGGIDHDHFDAAYQYVRNEVQMGRADHQFFLGMLLVSRVKEVLTRSQKSMYAVLNAIIFSVSVGAGVAVNPPIAPPAELSDAQWKKDLLAGIFSLPQAFAQADSWGRNPLSAQTTTTGKIVTSAEMTANILRSRSRGEGVLLKNSGSITIHGRGRMHA